MRIDRRIARLEEQIMVSEDDLEDAVPREFYKRLAWEELCWLTEPADEAQGRVPCPSHESFRCDGRSDERVGRGFEAYPTLREEFSRRWLSLYERREEILARKPEDVAATRRKRHGFGA